jgi:S-adenosylmethionine uptake transporter
MQALWMVLASLLFATMSVCVKLASEHFSTAEMVCYRGVIGIAFMATWCRMQGVSLKTAVPMMHLWRSAIGVLSLAGWFYSLAYLPVATAMTLNYMSGVWIAAFLVGGTLLMGRLQDVVHQGPIVLTVMGGFAGVILLLQPTIEQNQLFAGLIGVLSGLGAAFAYLQVSALGRVGEPASRTVLYFSAASAVAGGMGMVFTGVHPWHMPQVLWLLPIGLLAALGQLCMTRAYAKGATLVVANLQYSGIVFSALYGLLLFGDQIPLMGWAGMALIMISGMAATLLRARALPQAPAEEH